MGKILSGTEIIQMHDIIQQGTVSDVMTALDKIKDTDNYNFFLNEAFDQFRGRDITFEKYYYSNNGYKPLSPTPVDSTTALQTDSDGNPFASSSALYDSEGNLVDGNNNVTPADVKKVESYLKGDIKLDEIVESESNNSNLNTGGIVGESDQQSQTINTGSESQANVTNKSSDLGNFFISPERQKEISEQVARDASAQNYNNISGEQLRPSDSTEFVTEPLTFDAKGNIINADTSQNNILGNTAQSVYMRSDGTVDVVDDGENIGKADNQRVNLLDENIKNNNPKSETSPTPLNNVLGNTAQSVYMRTDGTVDVVDDGENIGKADNQRVNLLDENIKNNNPKSETSPTPLNNVLGNTAQSVYMRSDGTVDVVDDGENIGKADNQRVNLLDENIKNNNPKSETSPTPLNNVLGNTAQSVYMRTDGTVDVVDDGENIVKADNQRVNLLDENIKNNNPKSETSPTPLNNVLENTAQSVYMRTDGTYDSVEATKLLQKTNNLNNNLDEIWKSKDNTIKVVNGNLNPKTRQKLNVASLFNTVSSNISSWRNGLVVITTSLTNGIKAMDNVNNTGSGVDTNLDYSPNLGKTSGVDGSGNKGSEGGNLNSLPGLGKTTGTIGTSKQGSNGYIKVSNDINNGTGTIINNKNKLSGIDTISTYNLSKKQNDITKTIDKKTPSINIIDKKENKPEEPINKNLITSSLGKITFNKVVDLKESLSGESSVKCDLNVSYGLLGINKQNDEYYYMIIDQETGKLYYVPTNSDFNIEINIENVLQINDTTMLFNSPQTDVNQGNYAGLIQKDNLFFIKEQVTNNGVDFVKILNPKDGKDYYVALSDTNEVIKLESITGVNESI